MVWAHPPDTCEAAAGTILDAAYVVWQRLIRQTQISRSATRSKSSLRILKPAPSNCFAGSFPLLIQFRIVFVETFRYPAAPCTVRGSSPSARFNSRRSSSGSDVSIIKISPTTFIISPLADKVIRAADSLIALNFDSCLVPANLRVSLKVKYFTRANLRNARSRLSSRMYVSRTSLACSQDSSVAED
jgi:hypothetical protein